MSYTNAYIWDLENGIDESVCRAGRNWDWDIENRQVDTVREGRVGQTGSFGLRYIYTHMYCAVLCLVAHHSSCVWPCKPMDCSSRDSSVHEDSPDKNTGVGCHALLQGIFPTWELNPGLPHCRWILYHLSDQGSPGILEWVVCPFSRGSPWPRNWTGVSCLAGRFFTSWAIEEAHIYTTMCKIDSWWSCFIAQGTQDGALWWPGGVGGRSKREGVYVCR